MTDHTDLVRHTLVSGPSWDTKQRCACGAEFASRCEFWKHQADAYVIAADAIGCTALRLHDERVARRDRDAS